MELTSQRSIFTAWRQRMNARGQAARNRAALAHLSPRLLRDIGQDCPARERAADFPRFGI